MQIFVRCACVLGLLFGVQGVGLFPPVFAADYTWTGGSGAAWSNVANWSGGVPASSSTTGLIFSSSGTYTGGNPSNNIASPFDLWQLTVAHGAPAICLTGSGLAFSTASQSGIYQESSTTTTIDNPLSWSGDTSLSLSLPDAGGLQLNGGLTTTASSTVTQLGSGSLTFTGSNNLAGTFTANGGTTAIASGCFDSANLNVGNTAPATMTISASGTKVNVSNLLELNCQATAGGSTAYLNLQGGALDVTGTAIVGGARMDTSPTDTSALFTQSGGSCTVSGPLIMGQLGLAQGLYNINAGVLSASGGLTVGNQGNGVLNVSGSGNVSVTGTAGLSIGGDETGATGGTVDVSGGSLEISGNLLLGNSGVGTLVRSGGALTVSGSLLAGGAGTLILNGSVGSVATHFGGTLTEDRAGTLVLVPETGQPLGNEALTFGQSSTLTDGIVGAWAVRQVSGSNTSGDYLTLAATSGGYALATANYSSSFSATSVVSVSSSGSIGTASAYAVKFGSVVTTLSGGLTVASGGMILNGGTLNGNGSVSLGGATGMLFAGSSTSSIIATPLTTDRGLTKFGPGTLILAAANPLTGGILVSSGILGVSNAGGLGPLKIGGGNDVLVAGGATLELSNNIGLPGNALTISGSGAGNSGALCNLSGTNSLSGALNLANNAQIASDAGCLTLGPIQGSYNLTKTGTGTLALSADSSSLFWGSITVAAGVLDLSNSGALGAVGGGGCLTVDNGAAVTIHGNINLPAIPMTLSGSGAGLGALQNTQDANSIASPITLWAASVIGIQAGSLTIVAPISGSYGLTKSGSGLLSLTSAASTFSGPLAVAAGTLSVAAVNDANAPGPLGQAASAVTLGGATPGSGGSATFDYRGAGSGSSTRPFSIAANGTGVFQVDNLGANLTLSGAVSGSGGLVKTGSGTLTLNGPASYSGSTCVSQGVLAIAPGGSLTNTSSVTVCAGAVLQLTNSGSSQIPSSATISLQAGALTFLGNGSTTSSGQIAGSLVFGGGENDITATCLAGTNQPWIRFASLPASPVIGATVDFLTTNAQVQLSTSAGLSNGILGGAYYANGSDFATLSGGTLVEACSAYATGNLGTLGSSATANAEPTGSQTVITAAQSVFSLNLTGLAGVTMSGSGGLTLLSGGLIANTAGGIQGGVLKGSPSGQLIVNSVQDVTITSTIQDNGGPTALVKTGPGTLTLAGTTSYTGPTFLNEGTLVWDPPANQSYSGSISGLGDLTKAGTATLTLSGTSNYSGSTTISAGNLCINGELAQSTVMLQNGVISGGGTVGGSVTATGGAIALSSSGTILGAVNVTSGTLLIGQAGVGNYLSTAGGLNLTGAAVFAAGTGGSATIVGCVNDFSSASSTYAGVIAGSGSVLKLEAPAGTLVLANTATSTFGGVVIQGGMLKLGTTAALSDNPLTVDGGTLNLGGLADVSVISLAGSGGMIETSSGTTTLLLDPPDNATDSYSGSIANGAGTLGLVMEGAGTLILSGSDTYSGGTTVSDGTLELYTSAAFPDGGSLTVGAGAASMFGTPLIAAAAVDSAAPVPVPVPEPGALVLILAGLGSAAIYCRFFGRPKVACREGGRVWSTGTMYPIRLVRMVNKVEWLKWKTKKDTTPSGLPGW